MYSCSCDMVEKRQFHTKLYSYGVQTNICRLSSAKSTKEVTFVCSLCQESKSGKVVSIMNKSGICDDCFKTKEETTKLHLHERIQNEIIQRMLDATTTTKKSEVIAQVAQTHQISEHKCRELYSEIPLETWLNIPIDYDAFVKPVAKIGCKECGKILPKMKEGSILIWKGEKVCDSCWCNHETERKSLWEQVRLVWGCNKTCKICKTIKEKDGVRFQFDHLNMFDKNDSISSMILRGESIDDIETEIDKCQFICLSCHHLITEIENTLPFTQAKKNLTRQLNEGVISEEEHHAEMLKWNVYYEEKMEDVYLKLQMAIEKQQTNTDECCPYCLEEIKTSEITHPNINIYSKKYVNNDLNKIVLNIDPEQDAMGKYTCDKCKNSVHYSCFERYKLHQLRDTNEYKQDMETYESDVEDIEDYVQCPCCRHENGWFRHNVDIVSRRKNRADNPSHIEYYIRNKYNMSASEYLSHIHADRRAQLEKAAYIQGHTFLE